MYIHHMHVASCSIKTKKQATTTITPRAQGLSAAHEPAASTPHLGAHKLKHPPLALRPHTECTLLVRRATSPRRRRAQEADNETQGGPDRTGIADDSLSGLVLSFLSLSHRALRTRPPTPTLMTTHTAHKRGNFTTHLTSKRHGVIPAGSDADLPHETALVSPRLPRAGEGRDEPRLQHVLLVAVPRVLVLAEGVHRALPGKHARVHRAGVDFLDLAVEAFHPGRHGDDGGDRAVGLPGAEVKGMKRKWSLPYNSVNPVIFR